MLTCNCDFCGRPIRVREDCIVDDGDQIVRPRLVLRFADDVIFNKDCCKKCFWNVYDTIKERSK